MELQGLEAFFTRGLSPLISTIIITALIALSLPLCLHFYLYRSKTRTTVPSFLLLGPSGGGKTSLLTFLDRGHPTPTHTSSTPQTITCALPSTHRAASSRFRSSADPSTSAPQLFHLIDTPGHGKLRHFSLSSLNSPSTPPLTGLIFVVDAAALGSSGGSGITEAAEYLHDVLLLLQRRHTSATTSRGPAALPVLVAANKADLFIALPPNLVRAQLEREITRVRETRGKGLLDSGVDLGAGGTTEEEEDREWLGGGEGDFTFRQMEECDVYVSVAGGSVGGAEGEGRDVGEWLEWIAGHM
ncbi:MAG: hypothetical protein M1820_002761 [Bogoriella megaspora]|nr:MAG: hypothetical protein M1820_002761 [Bogoriella megaspora]